MADEVEVELTPEQIKEEQRVVKAEKKAKKRERKLKWKNSKIRKILNGFIWLGILGMIIGILFFNLWNIRDTYMRPFLDELPIFGALLPPLSEEAVYADKSNKELVNEIYDLKDEVDYLTESNLNLMEELDDKEEDSNRLQQLESERAIFLEQKASFDNDVADENPAGFIEYYESMYPENAESIYARLKREEVYDEDMKEYVAVYSSMEPDAVAGIFEQMMSTDVDLVVDIMENLPVEIAGEVLSAMQPSNASILTKLMAP